MWHAGKLGYETIPGEHPVVPLMVRDTQISADHTPSDIDFTLQALASFPGRG